MAGSSQVIAEIAAPPADLQDCFSTVPQIDQFNISAAEGDYFRCALTPRNGTDLRPLVFAIAQQRGWPVRELTRERHSLEDIYVHITTPEEDEA
jgi:ABC-2 type transport system ATP-binding protein